MTKMGGKTYIFLDLLPLKLCGKGQICSMAAGISHQNNWPRCLRKLSNSHGKTPDILHLVKVFLICSQFRIQEQSTWSGLSHHTQTQICSTVALFWTWCNAFVFDHIIPATASQIFLAQIIVSMPRLMDAPFLARCAIPPETRYSWHCIFPPSPCTLVAFPATFPSTPRTT